MQLTKPYTSWKALFLSLVKVNENMISVFYLPFVISEKQNSDWWSVAIQLVMQPINILKMTNNFFITYIFKNLFLKTVVVSFLTYLTLGLFLIFFSFGAMSNHRS